MARFYLVVWLVLFFVTASAAVSEEALKDDSTAAASEVWVVEPVLTRFDHMFVSFYSDLPDFVKAYRLLYRISRVEMESGGL